MKILMIAGEVAPYAKTGGLGEVMQALPKAVHRLGHDVRVFMPLHGSVDRDKFAFVPIGKSFLLNIDRQESDAHFSASILSQEVPIYFFESETYFPRNSPMYFGKQGNLPYYAFNLSVFRLLDQLDWVPDVIQIHDWQAGLVANMIKRLPVSSPYKNVATVQTIHNSAYVAIVNQWNIPADLQDKGMGPLPTKIDDIQRLNFLKRGIINADIVTTVSEQYARELQEEKTGHGLHQILGDRSRTFFGIRNGVDYTVWNPLFDPHLPVNYDWEIIHRKYDNKRALQHRLGLPIGDQIPILGMNSRITEQKGFSLVFEIFEQLMQQGLQVVVVGTGAGGYVEFLTSMMEKYPEQVAFRPYSEELGSLVYAGSDIFLMPSLFEPSGLGQLVSLRYGTVPVVRRTGGLADTISNYNPRSRTGNGFVFDEYRGAALLEAIERALQLFKNDRERWIELIVKGMLISYSWELPAKKYVRIFKAAIKERAGQPWSISKR
jgi:starch synthase